LDFIVSTGLAAQISRVLTVCARVCVNGRVHLLPQKNIFDPGKTLWMSV